MPDPVVTGLGARSGDHTGAVPWRDDGVRGADFASSASAPALKALRTQIASAHAADDPALAQGRTHNTHTNDRRARHDDRNLGLPRVNEPELLGQTVVIIGGSAGIGLETARRARADGAEVILTARNPAPLAEAARQVGALSTAAFDANDSASLEHFFDSLPDPIDHVLVTAGGPHYGPLLEMDADEVRHAVTDHLMLELQVARHARGKMRAGGTLLFMSGTGGGRIRPGLGILAAATAALPPFTAALALELAPVRVNLIAAGFVDTPLSASLLGDGLEARREELRATLPIGRVVGPADVAALAVHIMTNTALTGATYDIDGGQQFVG